jgi:hypothetical protein
VYSVRPKPAVCPARSQVHRLANCLAKTLGFRLQRHVQPEGIGQDEQKEANVRPLLLCPPFMKARAFGRESRSLNLLVQVWGTRPSNRP